MVKRLTEKPFTIKGVVSTSAANTYTELQITSPAVPVIGKGKFQGLEIMEISTEVPPVIQEAGQANSTEININRDTADTNAARGLQNRNTFYRRVEDAAVVEVTAVGEIFNSTYKRIEARDMTDHDGNGRLLADRTFFAAVMSTGLPSVVTVPFEILAHIIELDTDEIATILLEAD